MGASERFDEYMAHLAQGLGHSDRHAGLKGYCTGLMLPLSRKSVEPMAARVDPVHASARHQALHHFVAKAEWSDSEMLRRVCQWVVPQMDFSRGGWWIIDDTGFPKKGKHSVGVARQYCGMLGKQDNCQVAVSVSLACDQGSVAVAWQLYLPEDWAADPVRRLQAGVPEEVRFATKTQIALAQLRGLLEEGAPHHCVLADAGYGVDTAFRQALSDMGLLYAVGVTSAVVIWPPGVEPFRLDRALVRGRCAPRPVQVPRLGHCVRAGHRHLASLLGSQGSDALATRLVAVYDPWMCATDLLLASAQRNELSLGTPRVRRNPLGLRPALELPDRWRAGPMLSFGPCLRPSRSWQAGWRFGEAHLRHHASGSA